jgi:RimJ/RimL family protein N-acetyltransferase
VHVVLRTDRLLLRRFTGSRADEDALVGLDGDPAVMRFISGGVPTPREVVREQVLPGILDGYARDPDGRFGRWAGIERGTGAFVGWFGIRRPSASDDSQGELGYRMRSAFWGRGYATEATSALVDRAFAEFGLRRVWAETMAVNTPSRRVMERLGMRHVRTFHLTWDDPLPGVEHGEVEYEICRSDWLGSRRDQQ